MNTQNTAQARIADYIRPLKARWWLIVVAVVVATGSVYAYYAHKPNVYNASTLVYYQNPGDVVTGTPTQPQTDRNVVDAATLLDSRSTADAVAKQIHYPGTGNELLQHVSIGSKSGSDFITISSSAGTAQQAAAITNAFGRALVRSLDNGVTYQIESALRLSEQQLTATPSGPGGEVQRADLQDQINRLELSLKVPTLVAQQVDSAVPPASPSSPKPARDALFALVISLVGAIALAYGLQRFDRRLKNPEEMEAAYGRPLLAVLPHATDPTHRRDGKPALGPEFREPFRILRTNIELESLDAPPRTIVVSSATPQEGKSTVVRNMALAFCETGKSVAVVDLDLRNPALPLAFGIPTGRGMTEVLRHELSLAEAGLKLEVAMDPFDQLFAAATASARTKRNGTVAHTDNGNGAGLHRGDTGITLIRTGERPANAPAVLASGRLIEVLTELRERYDIVLIDSAPLLAVADSVPLLRYADATILVGRLDVTTRDTAKRLMEFIDRIPDMNLLGIVANDLSRLEAGGYGYGYGYGYGPYGSERTGRDKRAGGRGQGESAEVPTPGSTTSS